MNTKAFDNLAKFCYDCGKVSFAVLIIGALARSEGLKWQSLCFGFLWTLILVSLGILFDLIQRKE